MERIDYNEESYYFGGSQEAPFGDPTIFPLRQEDIDRLAPGEGGTGNVDPEQTEVTYTENGVNVIEPSEGFDGMSSVKVTVEVPQKTVKDDTVEISTNENGVIALSASDYDVDGLKSIEVTVEVPNPSVKPEPINITATTNSVYTINAADYNVDGLSSVQILVNVEPPTPTTFYYSDGTTSLSYNTIIDNESYNVPLDESLISVEFGNSVTRIADSAFSDCRELSSVTLSNGISTIGSGAFNGTTLMTEIIIPSSVTNIGSGAFEGDGSSRDIDITFDSTTPISLVDGTEVIDIFGISGSYATTPTIHVPEGYEETYATYDEGWDAYAQYIVGYTLTGGTKFYYLNGEMSESFNRTLTENSFDKDTALSHVEIGARATGIAEDAFRYTYEPDGFSAITIPSNITHLENCSLLLSDENQYTVRFESTTPLSLVGDDGSVIEPFGGASSTSDISPVTIEVPSIALNTYKTDPGWEYYADYIVGY